MKKRYPWSLLFLVGGSFAVAKGAEESGGSQWLGEQLVILENLPLHAILMIMYIFTLILTSFAPTVALASIILPTVMELVRHVL